MNTKSASTEHVIVGVWLKRHRVLPGTGIILWSEYGIAARRNWTDVNHGDHGWVIDCQWLLALIATGIPNGDKLTSVIEQLS